MTKIKPKVRDKEVNVLGHHNVTHHHEAATLARSLQRPKKEVALASSAEERHRTIAAEGDEMEPAGILVPL